MAINLSLRTADGREYPVVGALRIGRSPDSEVLLAADELVSRQHARVWVDGDRLLISDERSSNGTHVNDRALGAGETYRLRPGDRVRVGHTIFTVTAGPERAAQPLPGPVPVPPPLPAAMPVTTRIDDVAAPAPAPAASHGSRNLLLGGCLALVLLAVCAGLGLFGATAGRAALSTALAQAAGPATPAPGTHPTPTPGPGTAFPATPGATSGAYTVQVLPTSPPPTPLAPAAYAANSRDVAAALSELNQAQLRFIRDARGAPSNGLSNASLVDDLLNIAAAAFKVALGAENLVQASAVQAGGSAAAGQVAGLYAGLAQYGYAQALDAQNLRLELANGTLDLPGAAARVADFGARAWNPSVTDPAVPGNPFLPFVGSPAAVPAAAPLSSAGAAALQTSLGPQAGLQSWIAAPAQTVTRTVDLPRPIRPLGDPRDPALLASLITAAGQVDGDRASQADAAALQRLGATLAGATGSQGTLKNADLLAQTGSQPVRYQAPAAVVMTGDQQPGGNALPAFPGGTGAALAKKGAPAAGGDDAFVNNVFNLGDDNTPTKTGETPVTTAADLVMLSISNIQIQSVDKQTGFTEAKVVISFDLVWQTGMQNPQFRLSCNSVAPVTVNSATGMSHQTVSFNLILYPGNAYIHCSAGDWGRPLGGLEAAVLVGDPAEATQRADRVETEYVASGLTLTAEEANRNATQSAASTQTQAVANTQHALETEQAASQTAEFAAKLTQAAAGTATAQAAGVFTLNGTFSLVQTDAGCHFADAPSTSGTVKMDVNFNTGQVTATFAGGGAGTRSLKCNDDTGDMHWQQTYSVDFAGTVDSTSGALSLTGTLTGSNNVSWTNCKHAGEDTSCPAGYAHGYTFKVTLTGTVDKTNHNGSGTWLVNAVGLPTSGDWSAGQ